MLTAQQEEEVGEMRAAGCCAGIRLWDLVANMFRGLFASALGM